MSNCPHCKQTISLYDIKRQVKGAGFFKQEILYACPHCDMVLGISRGNYH